MILKAARKCVRRAPNANPIARCEKEYTEPSPSVATLRYFLSVDIVFCTCQNDQSGLIGRGKLLCTLTADENQLVKMVADEWW